MTNSQALRQAITSAGYKYKYIAALLGITPFGLQKKIDNLSEFKASEIVKLTVALSLQDQERNAIFFATEGDLKSRHAGGNIHAPI